MISCRQENVDTNAINKHTVYNVMTCVQLRLRIFFFFRCSQHVYRYYLHRTDGEQHD